jgi:hypothetical protein
MKKINEGILAGFAAIVFIIFISLTYKVIIEDNKEEKESKKELMFSVLRLSSATYENKIAYFIQDNGNITIEQLDSIREESDADTKHTLLKILIDKE